MAPRQIIAQNSEITAVLQEFGGDTVIVAFNEMGSIRNGDRFWGDSFFEKLSVTAIGVMTERPSWYPAAEMEPVLDAIRAVSAGRRIITYGHSQGGYGALKYSGPLDASAALAICPQWSISPQDVGHFDTRFTSHYVAQKRNGQAISTGDVCRDAFVLYDPRHDLDAANVERIGAAAAIQKVPLPYAGHEVIRVFSEAHATASLIGLAVRGEATALSLRRLARKARLNSPTHIRNLADRLLDRPAGGAGLLDGLARRQPALLDFHLALIAVLRGDEGRGLDKLAAACADPRLAPIVLSGWVLFRRAGNLSAERILAAALLNPARDVWSQLHGVQSLILAGEKASAAVELERLSGSLDAPRYADFFSRLGAIVGRS